MPTYGSKWPEYAKQWDKMEVRPSKVNIFTSIANKLIANKPRYQAAEKLTGVPWYMIALLHMRESDNNFNTQLAQGDALSRRSVHVPAGRGPFSTWEAGAYDALVVLKGFNRIIDWRLEKILYYSELYNGWGYHAHGVPSAYIWAGSTVYNGGKYVADGVWSSSAVDSQPGVASVLKIMMQLDPTIKPKRETTAMDVVATSGPVIAGGAVATQAPQHMWPWIIGGSIGLGLILFMLTKWLKKEPEIKETEHVVVAQS